MFIPLQKKFQEMGFDAVIIDYPHRGYGKLSDSAKAVARYIASLEDYYDHICFVGYSMGGVIGRYLVQCLPEGKFIDSYISLGSPHHGTLLAKYMPGWTYAAKQMGSGSNFCQKINSLPWPEDLPALALSAAWDCVVIPRQNSQFAPAECITIPATTHITLPIDPRTWIEIHSWLTFSVLEDELLFDHPKGYTAKALLQRT